MQTNRFLGKTLSVVFLASILFISNTALAEIVTSTVLEIEPTIVPVRELIAEPTIRVGLYKTSEAIKFTSDFIYDVWIGGEIAGALFAQDAVVLGYKNGVYSIKSESLTVTSSNYIRLVPQDSESFFTLVNYNRTVAGRKKINFNMYRGALEYRYSPKSKLPYIINELPLDFYVLGVAETYDSAPLEYIKALAVAARSYAYANIGRTPPTEKRMFDVYATTVDQLYLGYNSELFMPRVAQAAADTAGEMVTYKGNPVTTPYFSHSNGFTKNWKGNDRPWLKSVKAIYDKGKKMYGHGIGMSNYDAMQRAGRDGWTYDQILQYYYTSTTIEKIY